MKNDLTEISEKIKKKQDELYLLIEKEKNAELIYQKSTELDDLILEYIRCENKYRLKKECENSI